MALSDTNRIDQNDDHLFSDSEYHYNAHSTDKKVSITCCGKIRNKISPYTYEKSLESEHSISKTMESVQLQDAINCKISVSKAKLHRYLTTPNLGPKKKFAPYNIWNFPLALFNDYGIGTKLYFEFIVKLLWLSLFISICYIPIYCMLFSVGKFNDSSSFEQFSLGNLGDFNSNSTNMNSSFQIVNMQSFGINISLSYRRVGNIIAYTDFVCILCLLLFIIWFESNLALKEREYDDMTTTIGDYSIEVQNLPLTLLSRRSLADFFEEKWGQIIDVSICYNDGHIIKQFQKHSKIINDFTRHKVLYSKATKASTRAKETSKLQRIQTKLDQNAMAMLQFAQQFNNGDKHCVKAYVTFQNEPERNNCLREFYKREPKYFCSSKPRFTYREHPLQIYEPPEPSNVLYLNHGYTQCNLFFRRLLTTVLSTLIIIGSFGFIFAAQYLSKEAKIDTSNCDENIVYDAVEKNHCYCANIGIISAMSDKLCSDHFKSYLQSQGFALSSSVIVVIVNLILQIVIYGLVEREKHITVSQYQSALATKIFVSQFMNTALTILIIHCSIFNGEYDINFTYEWSQTVGNSIVITMILGCFNPHLVPILLMKFKTKKRKTAIEIVNTQNELNEKWNGEPFTLADRFANFAVKVCVVLLYTPLLPLLWFILFVTCLITYWFNKVFFLRIAAIPPKYDTKLSRNAVYFIKIGISLHLIMAVWVFGSSYRDPQYIDYNKYLSIFVSTNILEFLSKYEAIFKIIFNYNSLPFFLLFILLHLVSMFGKIIRNYICCTSKQFEDEAELMSFTEEYVRSDNMALYLVCTQPTLKNAFGPDLMPVENVLNSAELEEAETEYKKCLAKEMIDELMNVDIENDENENDPMLKNNNTAFLNVSPEFWSIREVATWLQRLKCGKKYMYQFMFKKVNGQRLINITDQFLEDGIEIKNLVDRSNILKAVRKLRIKAGLDPSLRKRKLTTQEKKELQEIELQNYTRHLILTDKYVQFAKECADEIVNV